MPPTPLYATPTHNLPFFIDTPVPPHMHQKCDRCFRTKGGHENLQLSRCASCQVILFCSKKCQKDAWPTHKVVCRGLRLEREAVAARTGYPDAHPDLLAWVSYYDTPLKNCAIASLQFAKSPHEERRSFLSVLIQHKGAAAVRDLPPQRRFDVLNVSIEDRVKLAGRPEFSESAYARAMEMGKIEFGREFYGVVQLVVIACYGTGEPGPENPMPMSTSVKTFSIDNNLARARVIREDWWTLLREYVGAGARLNFCCRKAAREFNQQARHLGYDSENGAMCCCGGWVHNAAAKNAFEAHKAQLDQGR